MLSLFYRDNSFNFSKIVYSKLEYLTHNVNSILYVIDDYYKHCNRYVRRPNMFVSLIENLMIDYTLPAEDVYAMLDASSIYAASDHGIVNGVKFNYNYLNDNVIYNTKEIIIAKSDSFDYLKDDYNLDSLACIWSNNSDIILTHPKMYNAAVYGSDIYIYSLDIPKLGMQYYYWCKEMVSLDKDVDPARFVYEVLLTNVSKSIFINNLVNRVIALKDNETVNPMVNYNPFIIKSLHKVIDKTYNYYLKKLDKKRDMKYDEILSNLPTLTGSTFKEFLALDVLYLNRRTKWVYILARINVVNFLLKNYNSKNETDYRADIETDFYRMTKNKYLVTTNNDINEVLNEAIDKLKLNLYI